PFSRKGFRETAQACAAVTASEGFTGASIDVIWDNADFHGGAKNMNVWDYAVCEGYGGTKCLEFLIDECRKHNLLVTAWVPAGHLTSSSPVWKDHPDWILKNQRGENFINPSGGIWHGALDSGFRDYYVDRVARTVRQFGLDGLWLDTHLSYAQQLRPADHSARLAAVYQEFIKAGAPRRNGGGGRLGFRLLRQRHRRRLGEGVGQGPRTRPVLRLQHALRFDRPPLLAQS